MAQTPPAPAPTADYTITERGPHHRVWSRGTWETNALEEVIAQTNSYTELQTGMHYWQNGQWVESRAFIAPVAGGAAATEGQHQVLFAANLNSLGAITLTTPDGKTLSSHILGLSYFDTGSGQAVLLATTQDSPGGLVGENQVLYTNAFNAVAADVQYLYTKAGLEQNVILRAAPPAPETYGLNPATTRLQVLTEFYNPPVPAQTVTTDKQGTADATLDFGAMQIGRGRAFLAGAASASDGGIRVAKQWAVVEGRTFLVESVPYSRVAAQLAGLAANNGRSNLFPVTGEGPDVLAALGDCLPTAPMSRNAGGMRLARAESPAGAGFVIDYTVLTSQPTFTFKGDTTYYVSDLVELTGTTTIEGGTVVKVAASGYPLVYLAGPVICATGPYRPAMFTAEDDDTVGDIITGSSGDPTGQYYSAGLEIALSDVCLHDLHFAYASSGLVLASGSINLTNIQFFHCQIPIDGDYAEGSTIVMDNCLFASNVYVIQGHDLIMRAQHITVDDCTEFCHHGGGWDGEVYLTNSVFIEVGSWGHVSSVDGRYNGGSGSPTYRTTSGFRASYTTDASPFQAVGAGSYYLATGSSLRDAGTTNISASLREGLKLRTTFPPSEIATNITGDTTLESRAARDTDTPDLGYHYDPLDYAVSGRTVSANLTLTNGVAVGTYGAGSTYGLRLDSGSLVSEGTPTRLNWIVRYNTVQEQSTTNWSASSVGAGVARLTGSATVAARFTGWSLLAGVGDHYNDGTHNTDLPAFSHAQFGGGRFTVFPGSVALTNCLWERVYVTLRDDGYEQQWYLQNNLLHGGTLYYRALADNPVLRAYDNLFDQVTITRGDRGAYFTHDYNGYVTNQNRLSPTGAHDVILTNAPVYQTSWLGNYYYPTNDGLLSRLIDAGSVTNAALASLYHFTTTTNQVKEANTTNDIGFHYVAVDSNGNPLATYWMGMADYLADSNGALGAWLTQYFGQWGVDPNDDPDGDWIANLQEYQGGSNPVDTMVVAWGDNRSGQCNVPPGLRSIVSLGGGTDHSVASPANGTPAAWGGNAHGQTTLPVELTGTAAIAGGNYHSLALRPDGTVTNWGTWYDNQNFPAVSCPSGLANIVGIAAGLDHDLALKGDGTVIAWGCPAGAAYTNVPAGLDSVRAIAAGASHSTALRSNGTVVAWGTSDFGITNVPAGLANVTAIAMGDYHVLALKADGTVTAWGAGGSNGTIFAYGQSIVPAGLSDVAAIAAGGYTSLALRSNGTVVAWGYNGYGQTNVIPGLGNVAAIGSGRFHELAVRSGRLTPLITEQPVNQFALTGSIRLRSCPLF